MPKNVREDSTKPSSNFESRLSVLYDSIRSNKQHKNFIESQLKYEISQKEKLIKDVQFDGITQGARKIGLSKDMLSSQGQLATDDLKKLNVSIIILTRELENCNLKESQLLNGLSTLLKESNSDSVQRADLLDPELFAESGPGPVQDDDAHRFFKPRKGQPGDLLDPDLFEDNSEPGPVQDQDKDNEVHLIHVTKGQPGDILDPYLFEDNSEPGPVQDQVEDDEVHLLYVPNGQPGDLLDPNVFPEQSSVHSEPKPENTTKYRDDIKIIRKEGGDPKQELEEDGDDHKKPHK